MPPAALQEDTPVKSTVSRTAAILWAVISASVAVGFYAAVFLSQLNSRLASIETFMRHEAVTQSQAERYAAVFKWENRDLRIIVPDPELYQDKPRS